MKLIPKKLSKKCFISIALLLFLGVSSWSLSGHIQRPPVTGDFNGPEDIAVILRRACYDCHSNETNLRWYDKLAPISWLVAADVNKGRAKLNFSTWQGLSAADQQAALWDVVNVIANKWMPVRVYLSVHPSAAIAPGELSRLKGYVRSRYKTSLPDYDTATAAKNEFKAYREKQTGLDSLPTAANGVQYVPGFRQWQVISSTNRFDNNSIRIIYGNPVAAKAVKENQINPWPEGSTLVKVVWNSLQDSLGNIRPGTLNSVQVMTKDNRRFPASKGWGFAKFNGIRLAPFGETAAFSATCFDCHKQASDNGYVFNLPFRVRAAAID